MPNNYLKQKAIKSYDGYFRDHRSRCNSFLSAFFVIFILNMFPFAFDLYLDIDLTMTYKTEADNMASAAAGGNETVKSISGNDFKMATWISAALITPSLVVYFVMAWWYISIPELMLPSEKSSPRLRTAVKYLVAFFKPLFFPLFFIHRKYKSTVRPDDPGALGRYGDVREVWVSLVRRLEVGLEAVGQIILQLWILIPYYEEINQWSSSVAFDEIWSGYGHIISLSSHQTTFLGLMLAKLSLSAFVSCVTLTMLRMDKNVSSGIGSPIAVLTFFVATVFQMMSRSITLVMLFITSLSPGDKLAILLVHLVVNLAVKFILESPPTKKQDVWTAIKLFVNMVSSAVGCLIFYMNVDRTRIAQDYGEKDVKNTFLPTFAHFVVAFIAYLSTAILFLVYPPLNADTFSAVSKILIMIVPLLSLILATVLETLYYRFLHVHAAGSAGPTYNAEAGLVECNAVVCCKLVPMSIPLPTCCSRGKRKMAKRSLSHGKAVNSFIKDNYEYAYLLRQ